MNISKILLFKIFRKHKLIVKRLRKANMSSDLTHRGTDSVASKEEISV